MQDLNLLEAIDDEKSSKIVIDGLAATTTSISDELSEHFKKIARNDNVFRKFRIELARIMDKNSKALQDSVLGLQLLINKNDEDNILKILEITAEEIRLAYDNSPCYQKFGKDLLKKNQLLFLIDMLTMMLLTVFVEETMFIFLRKNLNSIKRIISYIISQ